MVRMHGVRQRKPNEDHIQQLLSQIVHVAHLEGAKIVIKRGWFWKTLHYVVMIATLGRNRKFLTGYYTTIGPWIGVPDAEVMKTVDQIPIIWHELVHVRQCKKFGLGSAIFGLPLFSLFYLFLPFPFAFAYFRWRFERVAYVKGIEMEMAILPSKYTDYEQIRQVGIDTRKRLIDNAVYQLTSGAYGWTWPFKKSVRKYFEEHIIDEPIAIRNDFGRLFSL